MSKQVTEIITCDGCQKHIETKAFKLHEELDVTGGSFGVTVLGPRRDYCRVCTIAALRKRAEYEEAIRD